MRTRAMRGFPLVGLALALSCAGPDTDTGANEPAVEAPGEAAPPDLVDPAALALPPEPEATGPMDPALRAAWIRTVQDGAGTKYALEERDGALVASAPWRDLSVEATRDAMVLTDAHGESPVTIGLRRFNDRRLRVPDRTHAGARVAFERVGIEEHYLHGPLGLEQGFVVQEDYADGAETIVLDVSIEADGYAREGEGDRLALVRGERRIAVTDLYAVDAADEPLDAAMAWRDGDLRIEVDVRGAAWPVVIDPLFTLEGTVRAPDRATSDHFGWSVAIDGDYAVVGVRWDDTPDGDSAGSAHVFVRSASGSWTHQAQLLAMDGGIGDELGSSVAIDGSTVVVGASSWDGPSGATDAGAAYVFTRSGTSWSQQARLTASDGVGGDRFSGFYRAVAVDGDTILVGAYCDSDNGSCSGSAYVFTRSGSMWTERYKMTPAGGDVGDNFGYSVSLHAGTAVVGAHCDDDAGSCSGSAYVFRDAGDSWAELDKLTASDAAESDAFGFSVDIRSDRIVVGAFRQDMGANDAGSVYVFEPDASGSTWNEVAALRNPSPGFGAQMGRSVAISGRTILAGAPFGFSAGAVHVFERSSGGAWALDRTIAAPEPNAAFGFGVDLSGSHAVVGAPNEDESPTTDNGAAYFYSVNSCGDGTVDPGEACDLGSEVNGTTASCCSATCAVRTPAHTCRPSEDLCDVAESCDGSSVTCPADDIATMGTVCRAADGPCDVAEVCNGRAITCPVDAFESPSLVCRASAGACDTAETCTGSDADCPPNRLEPSDTVCRAATGVCDAAELCTGADLDCPMDVSQPDGTACADGAVCNGDEVCMGGICAMATPLDCDDGNACTADLCAEPSGCANVAIPGCCNVDGDCGDADVCTADSCSGPGGMCVTSPITGCCVADADCDDENVCTTNTCDLAANRCVSAPVPGCCMADAGCDDGNACTTDTCDTTTGECTNAEVAGCCLGDGDCSDDNTCTMDACDPSTNTCTNDPIAGCCLEDADCDDSNACTADTCDAVTAMCANDAIEGCCLEDADCDDADECTADVCVDDTCANEPIDGCGMDDDAGAPIADGGLDAGGLDAGAEGSGDGAVPGADGGSVGVDGGEGTTDGGCGCRAAGPSDAPLGWLLALGLLALRRRR